MYYDIIITKRHRLVNHSEIPSKMLRTLAVLIFVCPSIVFANLTISDDRQNVSHIDEDDNNMSSSAPRQDDGDGVLVQTTDRLPDQWVADLFYRALTNFRVQDGVGSSACQKQTQMYVGHLKNNSYWAVKSKFPKSI